MQEANPENPRRWSRWRLAGRALLGCSIVGASIGCSELADRPGNYTHYDSGQSAFEDDAVQRGVLPGWVPPDASDIHVQTELDVGHVWSRFSIDPRKVDRIAGALRPLTPDEIEALNGTGLSRASWWHECAGVATSESCQGFVYYEGSSKLGMSEYIAIDPQGRVYYWR